jgi:hypothetical protein
MSTRRVSEAQPLLLKSLQDSPSGWYTGVGLRHPVLQQLYHAYIMSCLSMAHTWSAAAASAGAASELRLRRFSLRAPSAAAVCNSNNHALSERCLSGSTNTLR